MKDLRQLWGSVLAPILDDEGCSICKVTMSGCLDDWKTAELSCYLETETMACPCFGAWIWVALLDVGV